MADEKTEDSDTLTATSPLRRHEDDGGSTHVLSETTDSEEWLEWIQFDDEVIPVASGSEPAQASNIPSGMSPKSEANQQSPIAHQVQEYSNWDATENPSFDPFMLESCQFSPSLDPIPPVSPVPPQAQTAASLPSLPSTVDFLRTLSPTSSPFQSQVYTARPVSHLAKETPPVPMSQDQAISGSRGSGFAQASYASDGPFLKRDATQPPPTSAREVRSRIDLSVPISAQPAPRLLGYTIQTAPVPPGDQTTDFISSISGYVDLSQTLYPTIAPPPSAAKTGRPGTRLATAASPLRISPELNRIRSTCEPKCPICRMDLAFDPTTYTLPCGHRFHGICLDFPPSPISLLPCTICPVCGRSSSD